MGHRPLAQRRDCAPGRCVVNVLVSRFALEQALHQPEVLDVIHATVPGAGDIGTATFPERVVEFRIQLLGLLEVVVGTAAFDVNPVPVG